MCPICATAIPDERYLSSAIVVINGKTKVSTNRRENLIYELLKHVESSLFKHKCFFQHQMQFLMGLLNDSSLINIPSMNQCYFNGIRLSMPSIFFLLIRGEKIRAIFIKVQAECGQNWKIKPIHFAHIDEFLWIIKSKLSIGDKAEIFFWNEKKFSVH